MLQQDFVPVAINQAFQRRQQDGEGAFYRRIASQSPRGGGDWSQTTQGFYIATPDGELLLYNNNRSPERLRRLMREALAEFAEREPVEVEVADLGERDEEFHPEPPEGGLVVRVHAKVLGGYEPTDDPVRQMFHEALSRDNLWVTAEEQDTLARGEFPEALAQRIARYHLIDNTRGEPTMWRPHHVRSLEMTLENGVLRGAAHLESEGGDTGYEVALLGRVTVEDGRVVGFALAAEGDYWGHTRYTPGCPEGRFPLAVVFRLADGEDAADAIPPQGLGWWRGGYLPR